MSKEIKRTKSGLRETSITLPTFQGYTTLAYKPELPVHSEVHRAKQCALILKSEDSKEWNFLLQ